VVSNPEGGFVALETGEGLSLQQVSGTHSPAESRGTDYFKIYKEHASLLRTWFVGFGIAVPVLCFTNQYMTPSVSLHGHPTLLNCFLSGIALQVALAFLNKHVMWVLYYGSIDTSFQQTRRYKWAEAITRWHGLSFALDAGTLILFTFATGKLFSLLTV
jgi:hypothetical protein